MYKIYVSIVSRLGAKKLEFKPFLQSLNYVFAVLNYVFAVIKLRFCSRAICLNYVFAVICKLQKRNLNHWILFEVEVSDAHLARKIIADHRLRLFVARNTLSGTCRYNEFSH